MSYEEYLFEMIKEGNYSRPIRDGNNKCIVYKYHTIVCVYICMYVYIYIIYVYIYIIYIYIYYIHIYIYIIYICIYILIDG